MTGHPPTTTHPDLSKGEQTRLEIMLAANQLFSDQGYHGTSMRQIAEQAGIALGGIYNHFENKEEIFTAVATTFHPIHSILPALEANDAKDIEEVVRQSAGQVYDTLSSRTDFMNLLFIELVEFKGRHLPGIFQEVFPQALGFGATLKDRTGELREDLPLPLIVVTFVGLMFMFFFVRLMFGKFLNLGTPQEMLEQVIDIYLHGIIRKEQPA